LGLKAQTALPRIVDVQRDGPEHLQILPVSRTGCPQPFDGDECPSKDQAQIEGVSSRSAVYSLIWRRVENECSADRKPRPR
jgi:hypothetical protein